ncbi:MAG: SUMF1/EgtB/PvdO family nonheme iron enzyme [Acidobacteriota bacterium]
MFCPFCGTDNANDQKYCRNCGASLPTAAKPNAKMATPTSQPSSSLGRPSPFVPPQPPDIPRSGKQANSSLHDSKGNDAAKLADPFATRSAFAFSPDSAKQNQSAGTANLSQGEENDGVVDTFFETQASFNVGPGVLQKAGWQKNSPPPANQPLSETRTIPMGSLGTSTPNSGDNLATTIMPAASPLPTSPESEESFPTIITPQAPSRQEQLRMLKELSEASTANITPASAPLPSTEAHLPPPSAPLDDQPTLTVNPNPYEELDAETIESRPVSMLFPPNPSSNDGAASKDQMLNQVLNQTLKVGSAVPFDRTLTVASGPKEPFVTKPTGTQNMAEGVSIKSPYEQTLSSSSAKIKEQVEAAQQKRLEQQSVPTTVAQEAITNPAVPIPTTAPTSDATEPLSTYITKKPSGSEAPPERELEPVPHTLVMESAPASSSATPPVNYTKTDTYAAAMNSNPTDFDSADTILDSPLSGGDYDMTKPYARSLATPADIANKLRNTDSYPAARSTPVEADNELPMDTLVMTPAPHETETFNSNAASINGWEQTTDPWGAPPIIAGEKKNPLLSPLKPVPANETHEDDQFRTLIVKEEDNFKTITVPQPPPQETLPKTILVPPDPLKTIPVMASPKPETPIYTQGVDTNQGQNIITNQVEPPPPATIMIGPRPDEQVFEQPIAPPRPSRRGLFAAVAVVLVMILVGAGLVLYKWIFAKEVIVQTPVIPTTTEPNPNPTPPPVSVPTIPEPPPNMVLVPAGEYKIGCPEGAANCNDGAKYISTRPQPVITLSAFYIDIYEVTNEEYSKFLQETGYTKPESWRGKYPGKPNDPVTGITWADASAYAKWAGKRLPTEEEWEAAAAGKDHLLYPWGNEFQEGLANTAEQSRNKRVSAVGSFSDGKSPFGVYDMAGNVWEWTDSLAQPVPDETIDATKEYRIIRGGSFGEKAVYASAVYRNFCAVDESDVKLGFRCVKDVPKQ